MADAQPGRRHVVRIVVLGLLVAVIALVWRVTHRPEGYRGGDIETTGTVEATHVTLGFKVPGRIESVPVEEGGQVAAGAVVATLEPQDFEVQVHAGRAAVATAQADLGEAEANRHRANVELARMRALMRGGATTQQLLDNASAAAAVANAQVAAARARIYEAETARRQAELQLASATLTTPRAGEVSERVHLPGEMVTAGTPVVTVAQLDTVKVHAAVDETRVGAVRLGDTATVRVYTFDKRTFPGIVTEIAPAGEFATRKDWGAQRRDIRTFDVVVRVPNPEGLLKDGMTADVTITPTASRAEQARR